MNCSVDHAAAKSYPAGGLAVNGDGVHTVSCTAWNNAVRPPRSAEHRHELDRDPHRRGATVTDLRAAEPQRPHRARRGRQRQRVGRRRRIDRDGARRHQQLDEPSDDVRRVASARPLRRRRTRIGTYTFRATACDNVGNCASASEAVALPVRPPPTAEVSLTRSSIRSGADRARASAGRLALGDGPPRWQGREGEARRPPQDDQGRQVRQAMHDQARRAAGALEACLQDAERPRDQDAARAVRPARHRPRAIHDQSGGAARQGSRSTFSPRRTTVLPAFSQVAVATTAPDGSWTATLPAGPSRLIRAVTDGTATILPSSGQVTTIVPARIRLLKVWPRHVAWGGTVHLVGRLLGGYLPPDGALVRLRIGYGSTYNTYGVQEHVRGNGRFSTVASFGPGDPTVYRTYWFQIASLPMGNYPYAPAASQRVTVIVGGQPRSDARAQDLEGRRSSARARRASADQEAGVGKPARITKSP